MAVSTVEKHDLAEQLSHAGKQCLAHASQAEYQDRELLEKASACFVAAIELQTDFIEAYLCLAFVCGILNLIPRALDLLNQAQNISPKDPRIAVLRKEIQILLRPDQQRLGASAQSTAFLIGQVDFEAIAPQSIQHCDAILARQLRFLQTNP